MNEEPATGTFPPNPRSWTVRRGGCGILRADDVECSQPAGHYPATMHRAYDPLGTGEWIEYDADGKITARSADE